MKLLDLLIEETELNIKLFHRLSNKSNLELTDFIRSAITNGLIRNDNGEVGNVIWFSDNYDDYAKNGKFVVSIDYNETNKEKYNLYYNNHNGYSYKDIPFSDLEIVKIPTLFYRNVYSSNELIELINKGTITPEKVNNLKDVTIYGDIFNMYVQPYIKVEDFISKINNDNVKIINIINN